MNNDPAAAIRVYLFSNCVLCRRMCYYTTARVNWLTYKTNKKKIFCTIRIYDRVHSKHFGFQLNYD